MTSAKFDQKDLPTTHDPPQKFYAIQFERLPEIKFSSASRSQLAVIKSLSDALFPIQYADEFYEDLLAPRCTSLLAYRGDKVFQRLLWIPMTNSVQLVGVACARMLREGLPDSISAYARFLQLGCCSLRLPATSPFLGLNPHIAAKSWASSCWPI